MKKYHTITIPPAYDGRMLLKYLKNELAFSQTKISSVKYDPEGLLLNGERVNLIVEFNEETGTDSVLGAQSVTQTGVVGKGYREMNGGDVITDTMLQTAEELLNSAGFFA